MSAKIEIVLTEKREPAAARALRAIGDLSTALADLIGQECEKPLDSPEQTPDPSGPEPLT